MKTIFFGSPTIAAQLLHILKKNSQIDIRLVVTQPDKPVGKKLLLTPTPVKQAAIEYDIPVFDKDLRDKATLQEFLSIIKDIQPELGILYAYGALISQEIIDIFPQGIWNVHPSLLPLYRGPSPTAYPLLLGDPETGVTIMKLVKKLDAGPIIAQTQLTTHSIATRDELEYVLTIRGAELIENAIGRVVKKTAITTREQDPSKSTYTRLLKKEDGYISSSLIQSAIAGDTTIVQNLPAIITDYMKKYSLSKRYTASEIVWHMYRALSSWPGIWTTITTSQGIKRVKIHNLTWNEKTIHISEIQLEGKQKVSYETFIKAYKL